MSPSPPCLPRQPHLGERLEGLPGHGGVPGQPDHSWGQGANRPPASLSGGESLPANQRGWAAPPSLPPGVLDLTGSPPLLLTLPEKPLPGREQDLRQDPGAHGAPRPPPQGLQAGGGAARRCPVSQGQLVPEDAAPRSSEPNLPGRPPRTGTGGRRSPPPPPGWSPPFRPLKATRNPEIFLLRKKFRVGKEAC